MVAGHVRVHLAGRVAAAAGASAARASCSRWCTRTRRRSWTWSAARSRARPRRGATPTPGATTSACWSAGWWWPPGRPAGRRAKAARRCSAWPSRSCPVGGTRSTAACGSASACWSRYVAVRLRAARPGLDHRRVVALAGAVLAVALVATPLGDVVERPAGQRQVQRRAVVPHRARGGRLRRVAGDRVRLHPQHASAAATRSRSARAPDCERCGNFTVGGNGQLWQLLYAHGAVGHGRLPRLLRVRPVAVPARPQRRSASPASAAIVTSFVRDALVQRAGHPAGLHVPGLRAALAQLDSRGNR